MKARTIGEIMQEVAEDVESFLHGFNKLKSEGHEGQGQQERGHGE